MSFVVRILVNAVALWLTTLIVGGNGDHGVWLKPMDDSPAGVAFTFIVVGFIFGLVNAIIGPVIRILSIPLYIITLGLFAFIVNGILLLITAWFSTVIGFGLKVDSFWWGVLGALILSIFTGLISLVLRPSQRTNRS
ncbi:phage holin family protein [Lysinibacter sp. HNR]|uniref:phage holin family protein n=1 Tax=Lysinibacter sp. HNR TaxID=3031408 RepID=UPI0024357B35|nr:phage holin family protein [Lysinibacter sp. HNR]WGD37305.1 phage holin family protein [Lysinibacter sp. HNR]